MYKGYLVSMSQSTGQVTVFDGFREERKALAQFDSLEAAYRWIDKETER